MSPARSAPEPPDFSFLAGAAALDGGAPDEAAEDFADEAEDPEAPIFGPVGAERGVASCVGRAEPDAPALVSDAAAAGLALSFATFAGFDSGLSPAAFVAPVSGFSASAFVVPAVEDEGAADGFGLVEADGAPVPVAAEEAAFEEEPVSPDFTDSGARSIVTGFFVVFECLGLLLCAIWDSFLQDDAWTPRPENLARRQPVSEAKTAQ